MNAKKWTKRSLLAVAFVGAFALTSLGTTSEAQARRCGGWGYGGGYPTSVYYGPRGGWGYGVGYGGYGGFYAPYYGHGYGAHYGYRGRGVSFRVGF